MTFKQWSGLSSKVKLGGALANSDRSYTQRHFEFRQDRIDYTGDPQAFFAQTGILDSSNVNRITFTNYVQEIPSKENNYDGMEKINAAYAMVELPVLYDLRLIGGARFETTRMDIQSLDTTVAELNADDLLPSVSLVYQLSENMNFRLAYGKTLARPTLRELSPLRTFEFLDDDLYGGNPDLKHTLIDNYDFRWEWFSRPGEIYAVSLFYKKFKDPIERVYNIGAAKYSHQNVDNGIVYGAEFEIRKNLDIISSYLSDFAINTNLSLIHSQVDIPEDELKLIRQFDSNPDTRRPLYGQSPYLVNIELSYANIENGTSVAVMYNVFGKRLSEVIYGATPDVYEMSSPILDLTATQDLAFGFKLKFSAKNLLNSSMRKMIEFKGTEYPFNVYTTGRQYSVGLSYSI